MGNLLQWVDMVSEGVLLFVCITLLQYNEYIFHNFFVNRKKVRKKMFFKMETWNFQHLFCKTLQNFNSIRQPIEDMKIAIVWISWMSWNFVRFHEILCQTDAKSFSFLSWKRKKLSKFSVKVLLWLSLF